MTYVRVADAAKLLGITRQAVYLAVKASRIQYQRQHGLLLVNPATFAGGTIERTEA